jgi:antitoxin ParD1/3/4
MLGEDQSMTTLNISLPKSMRTFVESQIKAGGYSTASEYVRDLIRDAKKRAAREKLEELLLEGINSGPGIPVDEAFWEERRETLKRNLRKKNSAKQK